MFVLGVMKRVACMYLLNLLKDVTAHVCYLLCVLDMYRYEQQHVLGLWWFLWNKLLCVSVCLLYFEQQQLPINKVLPSWLINLLHAWLAGCVWAIRIHLVETMQQFLYVECCCGWVEWMMSLRQMQRFFIPLLNASVDKKKMKNKLYFVIC